MSLKGKIIVITLITIVTLVGVGFATWTFTETTNNNTTVVGGAHAAIEANNVGVQTAGGSTLTNLYIICDSPSANGIYWSTTNDNTAFANRITQIKLVGAVTENDFDVADFATYTGTFTCSFAGYTGTYFDIPAISINENRTSADRDDPVEVYYTLPVLTYKSTPTSVAEVTAMQTAISSLGVTITFSFKVDRVNVA